MALIHEESLQWQGREVIVKRKPIKNLILKILPPGKIVISAPLLTSQTEILRFLCAKETWLHKHLSIVETRQDNSPDAGFDGKIIWYFGKPLSVTFKVDMQQARKALLYENSVVFITDKLLTQTQQKQAVQEFYMLALKRELEKLFRIWEARLGYYSSKLTIRNARSRWGSCNVRTAAVMINFRLVYRPRECLEYVVVHELAHLHAADHGPRFKAFMYRYLPDWRSRRDLLNNFLFTI